MTEFVEINLPSYSFTLEETSVPDKICVCCLRKKATFTNLASCNHSEILYNLLEPKMLRPEDVVCSWCHTMLRKIYAFKMQAIESFNTLNAGIKDNIKDDWRNLELSHIEQYYAINSEPIQSTRVDRANKNESSDCKPEVEIKIEQDFSDFENDLPLVEISRKIQINKDTEVLVDDKKSNRKINITLESVSKPQTSKPKGTRKKSSIQQTKKESSATEKLPQTKKTNRCGDKVKIVYLSEDQMWEERRIEAASGRYLKLLYKCDRCLTGFDHELTLVEHMEKRHKKEPGSLVCKICDSVLGSKYSYDEHFKRHYRRYECTVCGRRNNNVYTVLKHYSETHGKVDMTFKCKLCDFTTDSHRRLRYHRDKHRQPKAECTKCGKVFVNNTGLRVHMLNIHKISNRVYACEPCGKVYSNRSGLTQHNQLKHGDAAPAYCVPCDITFRSEAGLRSHLKNNSRHISEQDKRFQCSECGCRFMSKSLMQEHIDWVHLDSTKHTCSQCNKAFRSGRSLKKHVSSVHEHKRPPRNKMCDHCGRGFRSSVTLVQHIRTHTGERPLKCAHCGAAFAHSAALYTHNRLVHKKGKLNDQ